MEELLSWSISYVQSSGCSVISGVTYYLPRDGRIVEIDVGLTDQPVPARVSSGLTADWQRLLAVVPTQVESTSVKIPTESTWSEGTSRARNRREQDWKLRRKLMGWWYRKERLRWNHGLSFISVLTAVMATLLAPSASVGGSSVWTCCSRKGSRGKGWPRKAW